MIEMGTSPSISCNPPKPSICLLATFILVLILLDIQALQIQIPLLSSSSASWKKLLTTSHRSQDSAVFLPLKDARFAETAMEGHTWFMSSLNDTVEEDEVEYLYFPSDASEGRLLCLMGRDTHDGGENLYALARKDTLPDNATLMEGLTYVSDTYYDYDNLWHGLSAMAPFVGWYKRKGCERPARWVLFHKGELRTRMGSWVQNLMEATFGAKIQVERFKTRSGPFCFEKAVVMRHNLGKMGKEKRLQVYDLLRCKTRVFCNVELKNRSREVNEDGLPVIRLTLLTRKRARSFKNESAVAKIFHDECLRVNGCTMKVAQSENLSFCQQVRLMSSTDILASPHGAQLTNMFLMDRNSSVMEFFPKGWLELAGPGKYAHQWMASHSGMQHQGAWWDSQSDIQCPYAPNDLRCFPLYKNGRVGHNETFFIEWTRRVINQVKMTKLAESSKGSMAPPLQKSNICACE